MPRPPTQRLPSHPLFDDHGRQLSFGFEVEQLGDELTVVVGARWGTDHNRDYLEGLELLLRRLAQLGASLHDAWVDSRYTRRHNLPRAACRLPIRNRRYPVDLRSVEDFGEFRKDLLFRIGQVGLPPDARGGHTPLKQIRLAVSIPPEGQSLALLSYLSRPSL